MDSDQVDYILNHFSSLMTKTEAVAWRHYTSIYKLDNSENPETIEARKRAYLQKGWMTDNLESLRLLDDGIDEFRIRTAKRIFENHDIHFNNCPECKKLTRTPKALQCRFCGINWR